MRLFATILLLASSTASAVTLTADLRTSKQSATCDWNPVLGTISANKVVNGQPFDYGTGADGDCRLSGTLPAREYNCRTLSVAGSVRFTGTTPVVIRVQGDAQISGSISVAGFDGNLGSAQSPADVLTAGGLAGPGGFAGGRFESPSGIPASYPGDQRTTGAGDIGFFGTSLDAGMANLGGGGGGGGGSFGDATPGETGEDGTIAGNAIPGTGGFSSPADTTANESVFENPTLFIGGAGGGAGGTGSADNGNLQFYPASGGGGGGALRIVAGGDITVTGLVSADGGKGGDALDLGGAGGGGAGGAIWLQAGGQVVNRGTIRAVGGVGGDVRSTLPARGGRGGAGGGGRIRLDDSDGIIDGAASVPEAQVAPSTPGAFDVDYRSETCTALSTSLDTAGISNVFRSVRPLATLNGGSLDFTLQESADGITWGPSTPLAQLATLTKRYLRFDLTLTNVDPDAATVLRGLTVDYDIMEKSELTLNSDIACGTIDDDHGAGPGTPLLTLCLGFALALLMGRRRARN